jgi:hypothetical protein
VFVVLHVADQEPERLQPSTVLARDKPVSVTFRENTGKPAGFLLCEKSGLRELALALFLDGETRSP